MHSTIIFLGSKADTGSWLADWLAPCSEVAQNCLVTRHQSDGKYTVLLVSHDDLCSPGKSRGTLRVPTCFTHCTVEVSTKH